MSFYCHIEFIKISTHNQFDSGTMGPQIVFDWKPEEIVRVSVHRAQYWMKRPSPRCCFLCFDIGLNGPWMTVVVDHYCPDSEIILTFIRNKFWINKENIKKLRSLFLPLLCLWNHQNSAQVHTELDPLKQASSIETGKFVG